MNRGKLYVIEKTLGPRKRFSSVHNNFHSNIPENIHNIHVPSMSYSYYKYCLIYWLFSFPTIIIVAYPRNL